MSAYIKLFIFLVLTFYFDYGNCVKILKLSVPPVVDLQEEELTLDCKYDMEKEELYSVKWYKDEQEFFRYVPSGDGIRSFYASGVSVATQENSKPFCDFKHCPVTLTNLSRSSEGFYKCEISTEGPTFKIFSTVAKMSIVALPRGSVTIATPRTEYSEGDEIFVNCTSPPSDPPPKIRWYINDRLVSPSAIIAQSDSTPDDRGLITRSLAARMTATRDLFLKNNNLLALRCEVNAPQQLPLHATVYMTLYELKEQKFDWLSSKGICTKLSNYLLIITFFIFINVPVFTI